MLRRERRSKEKKKERIFGARVSLCFSGVVLTVVAGARVTADKV